MNRGALLQIIYLRWLRYEANKTLSSNFEQTNDIVTRVKMNLYSIRFFNVFLLEEVCAFSSAFSQVHIRLNRLAHIDKNFAYKRWERYFKCRAVPLYKKFVSENFCPVCNSLLSAVMAYTNADWKEYTFS